MLMIEQQEENLSSIVVLSVSLDRQSQTGLMEGQWKNLCAESWEGCEQSVQVGEERMFMLCNI